MPPATHARFVSEAKARLGKCITFGLNQPSHFTETSNILRNLTTNWRRIIVGREGYITAPERAGLSRHKIAWGDHDQMGHVNNVVYNFWAETARVNWVRNFGVRGEEAGAKGKEERKMWEDLLTPRGIGLILRSIKTEYKFPLEDPDRVTVIHKLSQKPKEGMDTLFLEAVVLSETRQRIAAKITEDTAVYDYRIRKKAPLPEFMVETLLREWHEQSRQTWEATGLQTQLEGRIRKIELETWDKEGAVEDMGAASEIAGNEAETFKAAAEKFEADEAGGGTTSRSTSMGEQTKVDEISLELPVSKASSTDSQNTKAKVAQPPLRKEKPKKATDVDETPLEFQVNERRG